MKKNLPPNFLDHEQGSPEWLRARWCNVTASNVGRILGRKKDGGYYKERQDYMDELVVELLTGELTEHYVTAEMQFGIDNENNARSDYEAHNEVFVDRVGFVLHPSIARCGASPDGIIEHDGGLEIKVPKTITHIRWRMAEIVPPEHRPQMLLNMDCCEREWWDFYSFDPRLKGDLQRFQVRLYRDEKEIQAMRDEIVKFLEEFESLALRATKSHAEQLAASLDIKKREAIKQSRGKYSDEQLTEMLKDEGISVP